MADIRKVTIYLSYYETDRLRVLADAMKAQGRRDAFHKNGRVNRSAVIGWLIQKAKA